MPVMLAGVTNALDSIDRPGEIALSLADYQAAFDALPETVRSVVADRWGAPAELAFILVLGFITPPR